MSSNMPWLYYCWWYLEMCMYTLANLLLLAPILTCALISVSLISALVKAWLFCTLTLEAYFLKWINWKCVFTAPDVLVITEMSLRKSVLNTDVNLSGYNLFRQDKSSKVGGVAIFTKDHLRCSVVSTKSVPKQFYLLVLSITLSNSSLLTVAGCLLSSISTGLYPTCPKLSPGPLH